MNQVMHALELEIDVAPGGLDLIAQGDQTIVDRNGYHAMRCLTEI